MHRLLKRQIRRYFNHDESAVPESMQAFLEAVSAAYEQADRDRETLERSIDLMSQELLQANQQLRSAIPDLFLRLDWTGVILDYLPGHAIDADHYLSGINPIGSHLSDHLPSRVTQKLQQGMELARTLQSAVEVEHTLEDAAGHKQFYEVRILGMFDQQAVLIVRNITERKQAERVLMRSERQLRQQSEQLQAALEALKSAQAQLVQQEKLSSLGQLVAGLAHEINNPLAFIVGNLRHLDAYALDWMALLKQLRDRQDELPSDLSDRWDREELDYSLRDFKACLNSIQTGANRITQLVLALRTFSRLDEATCKEVDLHANLDSTLLLLRHRYAPAKPSIVLERRYGQLPVVECYASQMNQVFLQVVSNALDAIEVQMARGGNNHDYQGRIVIATRYLPDRHWVEVRIADNGPGIPQAVQTRIFDPFFTTKPVGQGTGLGLSIAHQVITDCHRGQLTCRSRQGTGSEFIIAIPCRVDPPVAPSLLSPLHCSMPLP
jgi:signal transduction histidine kinase